MAPENDTKSPVAEMWYQQESNEDEGKTQTPKAIEPKEISCSW